MFFHVDIYLDFLINFQRSSCILDQFEQVSIQIIIEL